jgi:hypothetical protein
MAAKAAIHHDAAQAAEEAAHRERCEQQAALEAAEEAADLERCEQQAALAYEQGCARAQGDCDIQQQVHVRVCLCAYVFYFRKHCVMSGVPFFLLL